MRVELDKAEWDRILYVISNAHGPGINWLLTNPLLASLTTQLNAHPTHPGYDIGGKHYDTSEEARRALGEAHGMSTNSGDENARQAEAARRNFGVDKPQ